MGSKALRLWTLLCLVLLIHLATAQSFEILRRQDAAVVSSTEGSSTESASQDASSEASAPAASTTKKDDADTKTESSVTATSTGHASKTSHEAKSSSSPTSIDSDGPLPTLANNTIPKGQLPIQPEVTPGWGVAGAIMLISGVVYALIGIKNQWIHTFMSTAYLIALAVAVLILYVMSYPVSEAEEGGYVVAVVVSGCIIGLASTFFKELTEGLGCVLGGFCVSMWILCLVPGGALTSTASKAIFIACLSLGAFIFYFSRWTRDWALITMISFAGGTITVLGIDCFSRAGLKEFWAYVWDLNDNMFPYGASTYPVTRGIRVETAAIVIICVFGIISQIKLWRVVREKRQKRAEAKDEERRNLDEEEANLSRRLEETNARERREWERVHGDGDGQSLTNSDTDATAAEKGIAMEQTSKKGGSGIEVIEMTEMADDARGLVPGANLIHGDDGQIMVRVAADDFPNGIYNDLETGEKFTSRTTSVFSGHGEAITSRRISQGTHATQPPEVVPLPFNIPAEGDTRSEGNRSSVATFADDEEAQQTTRRSRQSLTKRLSQGSISILKSLSPNSATSPKEFPAQGGESSEDLVNNETRHEEDDQASVGATLDDESLSGDDRHSIARSTSEHNLEIAAELGKEESTNPEATHDKPSTTGVERTASRPFSMATVSTGILQETNATTENEVTPKEHFFPIPGDAATVDGAVSEHAATEKPKSVVSTTSTRASLTKNRLPSELSKIALSYRTNEWAKHLSHAETPEPDALQIMEAATGATSGKERAAPVLVENLQQTASSPSPETSSTRLARSDSRMSQMSKPRTISRSASQKDGLRSSPSVPSSSSQDVGSRPRLSGQSSGGMMRSVSSSAGLRRVPSGFDPIAEEGDAILAHPMIAEEEMGSKSSSSSLRLDAMSVAQRATPTPGVVSYSSPQTLLGQREMFLRSKSSGNLMTSTPEPVSTFSVASSDAGSLHNYSMYAAALTQDPDDLPLSQRKELMRRNSVLSMSGPSRQSDTQLGENAALKTHQPKRTSTLPTAAARESQLANFRQSVTMDLRAGSPMLQTSHSTPFASTQSLLGGREAEIQRNIELQRNIMLSQKDAEAQRRESTVREREWADRVFDQRMRSGDLVSAHREVMRKMQSGAKGS